MPNTYDVIIIGGGVTGCATAHDCMTMGLKKVLLLEKGDIGGEASGANGGGVRQSARDVPEIPLAMAAVKRWETLHDELGMDVEYRQAGNTRLCVTEAQVNAMAESVAKQRDLGLDVRMVDAAELREINPHVSDQVLGASWCPTDGHANPMLATHAFARRARQLGATFQTGETVVDLLRKQGRVVGVRTDKGVYHAENVVNAAGIHGRKIARMAGLDFPMSPVFTEVLVTEAAPPLFPQMVGTAASDFYGHQTDHGSFVFGGFAGYETFLHQGDQKPNYAQIGSSICRAVLRFFPNLSKLNVIRVWSGLIAQVSDKIPVLGRVEGVPGYISATGFSGHGFGIGPITGKLLAETVVHGAPSMDLSAFRHDRFAPKN